MAQPVVRALPAPPALPVDEAEAAVAAGSRRVVFVDLARALAVLMMVQGHTLHALLDPGVRHGPVYGVWVHLRSLTSPTFLLVSGFCFSVATLRRWDDHVRPSGEVLRRVLRFLSFVSLGYLLHFPVSSLSDLATLAQPRWDRFLQVDILQAIGVSLLLLQGLVLLARTPSRFAALAAGLAAAVFVVSPGAWSVDWHAHLPAAVATYLHPGRGSQFPLLGWAFFPLLGAALGTAFHLRRPATTRLVLLLLALGAGLQILARSATRSTVLACPDQGSGGCSPGFFFGRLAAVLLVLAVLAWLCRDSRRLPAPLQAVAEESLIVYFVHLCVVYGSIWALGYWQRIGATQTVPAALGWAGGLIVAMVGMAWAWSAFKRRFPRGKQVARLAIMLALVLPLL